MIRSSNPFKGALDPKGSALKRSRPPCVIPASSHSELHPWIFPGLPVSPVSEAEEGGGHQLKALLLVLELRGAQAFGA